MKIILYFVLGCVAVGMVFGLIKALWPLLVVAALGWLVYKHTINKKKIAKELANKKELEAIETAKKAAEEEERAAVEAERKRRYAAYEQVLETTPRYRIEETSKAAKRGKVSIVSEIPFEEIYRGFDKSKAGNFIALDLETTGLKTSSDEIIEVAAMRFRDWEPVEVFHTFCAPLRGLNPDAMDINKITADMVHDKPAFGTIAKSFESFLGDDTIVGHNLEFDLKFLVRYGVDLTAADRLYFDTLSIAREYIPKSKERANGEDDLGILTYSLPSFRIWYAIPNVKSHSALSDAYATGLLFGKLIDDVNNGANKNMFKH